MVFLDDAPVVDDTLVGGNGTIPCDAVRVYLSAMSIMFFSCSYCWCVSLVKLHCKPNINISVMCLVAFFFLCFLAR
jgi:hypothetical protein